MQINLCAMSNEHLFDYLLFWFAKLNPFTQVSSLFLLIFEFLVLFIDNNQWYMIFRRNNESKPVPTVWCSLYMLMIVADMFYDLLNLFYFIFVKIISLCLHRMAIRNVPNVIQELRDHETREFFFVQFEYHCKVYKNWPQKEMCKLLKVLHQLDNILSE